MEYFNMSFFAGFSQVKHINMKLDKILPSRDKDEYELEI